LATSVLGPCLCATLVTPDLERSLKAYCDFLHLRVHSRTEIGEEQARQWKQEHLAGAPVIWLANELAEPWLRLIGVESAVVVDPFYHSGWFSLEISVDQVDDLRNGLENSPFEIMGEPANLDVSNDIRAMQVLGPAGEMLYLTQVNAEVPPFELPFARCSVDRLFIPVLLTPDRDKSLLSYAQFPGTHGVMFETKITVINQARNMDIDHRHPVATIQLRGKNLVEIDQLDGLAVRPGTPGNLPSGISMITFAVDAIPAHIESYIVTQGALVGQKAAMIRGAAGELIELIQTNTY